MGVYNLVVFSSLSKMVEVYSNVLNEQIHCLGRLLITWSICGLANNLCFVIGFKRVQFLWFRHKSRDCD